MSVVQSEPTVLAQLELVNGENEHMRPIESNAKTLQRALTQPRLLNEIHFLFRRAPFRNGNGRDEGWMCREHSFVAASVGALTGFQPFLAFGKVALIGDVQGSSGRRGALMVDPHSWSMFEKIGMIDLSLNLSNSSEINWKPWPIEVLALGHPQLHTTVFACDEFEKWQQAVDTAVAGSGFHILYLGGSGELLSARYVKNALAYINSPLSDELRLLADVEIYSKAVKHLWGVCNRVRKCMCVSGISQSDAWKELSKMAPGATDWLTREASLPMD
jgi:hypothetical protein